MQQRKRQPYNAIPRHPGTTSQVPDWAGFHPATIVSLGVPTKPVERLIGLQSGVYRLIVILGNLPSLFEAWPLFRLGAIIAPSSRRALQPK